MSESSPTPIFSEGEDAEKLQKALESLLIGGGNGGKWKLSSNGKGLERRVRFKTFKKTWEFMNNIAEKCSSKEIRHHPEWSNVYNTTFIRWTTHTPSGISSKDIAMAHYTDINALVLKEELITPDEGEGGSPYEDGKGRELADIVASVVGDCCGGGGKSSGKEKGEGKGK